jgi:hypothetical protein
MRKKVKNLHFGWENSILSIMGELIENRFTGVGQPDDIYNHGRPLDSRQQRVLDELPEAGSRATFRKADVSMFDLSALTAKTGDEFAMFTAGSERVVMRGDKISIFLPEEEVRRMVARGYRWSGHTHPGNSANFLRPSLADKRALRAFGQDKSVIYNSVGQYRTFVNDD